MNWRKKTIRLAGKAREMFLRRKKQVVEVDRICRTANGVHFFRTRFLVLNGGRAA